VVVVYWCVGLWGKWLGLRLLVTFVFVVWCLYVSGCCWGRQGGCVEPGGGEGAIRCVRGVGVVRGWCGGGGHAWMGLPNDHRYKTGRYDVTVVSNKPVRGAQVNHTEK